MKPSSRVFVTPAWKRFDATTAARTSWNSFFLKWGKLFVMDEGKFNRLSLAERASIVWQHGKFVDSVICNNYCLMLYSVNRQFVELFLDLKSHSIVWISLANEYDLAKYLDDIIIEV